MKTTVNALLRDDLRTFAGYQSARTASLQGEVWLNANESAWANAADADARLRRYPQPQPQALRECMAQLYAVAPEQLLIGRGSDEAIDLLVRAFCAPGQGRIVIATPVYNYNVPASLKALHPHEGGYLLTLDNGNELAVKLVIGADGANSQVRQMAGIGVHAWQYEQSCMLITAECENAPGESTWQHFTPNGPHAFLPLFDNWASLVWYDKPARIRQLQGMNMEQLQREILLHFPSRLGHVTPVAAGAFPLTRRHALQYAREGLALVGDAAHTIHPLAGQGVNLGYRDVDALLDVLGSARGHAENWASHQVLKRYQTRRMADNFLMQSGMDLFYAGFSNDVAPVRILRNIGLMAAERAGGLKRQALKYALGL